MKAADGASIGLSDRDWPVGGTGYFCIGDRVMDIKLINIGFGNIVPANRVIAIVSPESAPIKRIITEARDRGQLIDATYGRRTRAVIVADSGHVTLSAIQPETVAHRFMVSKHTNDTGD
jgi:regulator of extracellular matrix RemA (YlzA/DUF370 family)